MISKVILFSNLQTLPSGLDKSVLMKNGKIPPGEMVDSSSNISDQTKLDFSNSTSVVDNLTESESLEQDGVLVVNVSTDNILNLDELYPNIQMSNFSNKMDEVTNKIQSNSREITGDSNNNIKFKDLPENITIAPAPTNGVIPTNEQEEVDNVDKEIVNTKKKDIAKKVEEDDLLKPTESLQSLTEETSGKRRRRRRRHGRR